MIYTKFTFWEHNLNASDEAAAVTTALGRHIGNVDGLHLCKWRLLLIVIQSILLYGSEVWAEALEQKKYRRRMTAAQYRGALRIAGAICVDLLAPEMKKHLSENS